MTIPTFEHLTDDILKAKLYMGMRERETNLEVIAIAIGRGFEAVDCSQAFKDNEEADKEVRRKYGSVKYLGGDN